MNATDLIQSFFDPGAVARLAQAAGLEPEVAERVLEAGLPLQLQALATGARTQEGGAMIAEATRSLPTFGSVDAALDEAGGAPSLQQAGELLSPALLGNAAHHLADQVAQQTAADPVGVQTLLQMALPLLLSRLGQAGLSAGNVTSLLANLGLNDLSLGGAVRAETGTNGEDRTGAENLEPLAAAPVSPPVPEHVNSDAQVPLNASSDLQTPSVPVPAPISVPISVPIISEQNDVEEAASQPLPSDLPLTAQAAEASELPETVVVLPTSDVPPSDMPIADAPAPAASVLSADAVPVVAAPQGTVPEGTVPEGTVPEGTVPEGTVPEGTVPEGTVPEGTAPEVIALAEAPAADPSTPEGLLAYLQARLGGSVGHQIGAVAGFGGGARRQAAAAALPVILSALVGQTQAGGGAIEVGKLRTMAWPFEALTDADGYVPAGLLDSPVEVARLEGQGRGLLGSLFGDLNGVTGRLGSALGGSGDSSRRLLALMTPLVLSALTRAHPEGLSSLLGQLGGLLPALLPAGLSSLGVVVRNLVNGTPLPGAVSASPAVSTIRASPSAPVPSPLKPPRPVAAHTPAPTPTPPPPPARRRSPLWWWLIPLLVLLLGGIWLLRSRPAASTGTASDTSAPVTATPGTPDPAGPSITAAITEPQDGAQVAATGFTLRGTGPADEPLTLLRDGSEIGPVTVGDDGAWTQEVTADAAPSAEQTYALNDAAGRQVASVRVQVGAAGDSADASPPSPSRPAGGAVAPGSSTGLTVGHPGSGAEVSDAGFALSGTGTPGNTFEVLEDGVSVGSFTVDADGNWTRQVPGPSLGAKTYVIRDAVGQEVASLPVTVAAAAATAQGAACTRALSVSLNDGDTVTAPYRFGGVGDASAYTVTVKRGERVIGTRTVQVGPSCAWNFTSNPGGAGQASQITYEVRAADQAASDTPAAQLTLNVQ